ncbi:hypothetical protein ACFOHY_22010 [Rhizobium rosettiformans]|uniref:hypothetical protein n=1 Tax=Rhizobium rosettiformans TaxID=1368430 RepID=UPI0036155438
MVVETVSKAAMVLLPFPASASASTAVSPITRDAARSVSITRSLIRRPRDFGVIGSLPGGYAKQRKVSLRPHAEVPAPAGLEASVWSGACNRSPHLRNLKFRRLALA